MKHQKIIEKMTLEQKASFVTGEDYWTLKGIPELGLPKITVTDGPHGLRKKTTHKKASDGIGLSNSVPATCFPTASTASCCWDEDLLKAMGAAIGEECLKEKVSVLLGPGTNIKRSPVCGRNFEYYSEDPYLAGKCAAAFVKGVQSKGVGTSLKHFACNSQEAYRMVIDELVDERALREIYLAPFEICTKEAQPWTVMNSYNRINGEYSSQNYHLQEQILRKEWKFEGLVITDWGSSVDRVQGLRSGTDLEMPCSGKQTAKKIIDAIKSGELDESILDQRVDNIIELITKSKSALHQEHTYSIDEHHNLAQKVAEHSMVLLKNDDILPLKKNQKIALIGDMAKVPRYQGAGSSVVNPTTLSNAYDELLKLGMEVSYAQGYRRNSHVTDQKILDEAISTAKQADVALVFVGLTEEFEAEGYDRANTEIPLIHNQLVEEITKVNENTVVILSGGSVVNIKWLHKVKGLLNAGLAGQASGASVANILTGKVNPSGKLTETYPLDFSHNPTYGNFPGGPVTSEHRESIYVGYRYYDIADKDVLFPFGFGLSYTDFEYSDIKLTEDSIKDTDTVTVSFKIKNTGTLAGAEIAQIYISDIKSTVFRPIKELRGFKKVFLNPGEEKSLSLKLSKRDFAFYNTIAGQWMVETGEFQILAGASSRDIRLCATLQVTSTDEVPIPDHRESAPAYYTADISNMKGKEFEAIYGKTLPCNQIDTTKKIDIYCCLDDASHTKWGKRIGKLVKRMLSKASNSDSGSNAMLTAMATQIPIRNFSAMSMGVFTPKMTEGLLMILNDDESTFIGFNKIFWGIGGSLLKLPRLLKSI